MINWIMFLINIKKNTEMLMELHNKSKDKHNGLCNYCDDKFLSIDKEIFMLRNTVQCLSDDNQKLIGMIYNKSTVNEILKGE